MIQLPVTLVQANELRELVAALRVSSREAEIYLRAICSGHNVGTATLKDIFDDSILVEVAEKDTSEVVADLQIVEDDSTVNH